MANRPQRWILFCAAIVSLLLVTGFSSLLREADEITTASVLREMNRFRKARGLNPFIPDSRLERAASDRMEDMEELGYWAHRSPDGRSPFVWLPVRGYQFRAAGENLATGFETAKLLVSSWMESKGHRDNILSTDFSGVGIAIIEGSSTGRAAGKSVVVIFAAEMVEQIRRPARRRE